MSLYWVYNIKMRRHVDLSSVITIMSSIMILPLYLIYTRRYRGPRLKISTLACISYLCQNNFLCPGKYYQKPSSIFLNTSPQSGLRTRFISDCITMIYCLGKSYIFLRKTVDWHSVIGFFDQNKNFININK